MRPEDFNYRERQYLHFDYPLGADKAWELASDPSKVAGHSFYPLIGFTVETKRYQRNEAGQKVRVTKEREIKICAHGDTAIYSYYGQLLGGHYESRLAREGLTGVVTAFRGRSGLGTNVDCAAEVFSFINANRPCTAYAFDISKFFDRIDHDLLKSAWAGLLNQARLPADHFAVYRSLTQFCWVERTQVYKALDISIHNPRPQNLNAPRRRLCAPPKFREAIRGGGLLRHNPELAQKRGIPQGSSMSAMLSNIYMLEFDKKMEFLSKSVGGLYRRYCDDIIFVVPYGRCESVEPQIESFAEAAKVELHPEKRHDVQFPSGANARALQDKALQYLGFTFDGAHVRLRLSSLDRYYSKMRRGVSLARQTQRKANRKEADSGRLLSPLRRQKLYRLYSYLQKRRRKRDPGRDAKTVGNFLTYAYRAADDLDSQAIRKQVRAHWRKLREEINKPIKNELRGP